MKSYIIPLQLEPLTESGAGGRRGERGRPFSVVHLAQSEKRDVKKRKRRSEAEGEGRRE